MGINKFGASAIALALSQFGLKEPAEPPRREPKVDPQAAGYKRNRADYLMFWQRVYMDERQVLLMRMTNWQRNHFMKFVKRRYNGQLKSVPLERMREFAVLPHWKKQVPA